MFCVETYGAMTVGDLIRELKTVPADLKVFVEQPTEYRDVSLCKLQLRKRMHQNGAVWEHRKPIPIYTRECLVLPGDGEPEDCICICPRSGRW